MRRKSFWVAVIVVAAFAEQPSQRGDRSIT